MQCDNCKGQHVPYPRLSSGESYLVFTGPESADSELHLVPLASLGARDVPHSTALGAPVDPDEDLQVPGAVAVAAVQEVAELDAVGVVLAERQQE